MLEGRPVLILSTNNFGDLVPSVLLCQWSGWRDKHFSLTGQSRNGWLDWHQRAEIKIIILEGVFVTFFSSVFSCFVLFICKQVYLPRRHVWFKEGQEV